MDEPCIYIKDGYMASPAHMSLTEGQDPRVDFKHWTIIKKYEKFHEQKKCEI